MVKFRQTKLPTMIAGLFSEGELKTLCFGLGLDYDELPGQGKADKARELVGWFERRGRLPVLVGQIVLQREECFGTVDPKARGSLPALPSASMENGDEAFYRYLRDTLHTLDNRTRRTNLILASTATATAINFVVLALHLIAVG